MRFIIIFAITLLLSLFIMFYNPYLGVYNDSITIVLDNYNIENYNWNYKMDNDNLKLVYNDECNYKFKNNKNGITNITFIYSDNDNIKYEIHYKLRISNNKIFWLEGYGKGLISYPNPI